VLTLSHKVDEFKPLVAGRRNADALAQRPPPPLPLARISYLAGLCRLNL